MSKQALPREADRLVTALDELVEAARRVVDADSELQQVARAVRKPDKARGDRTRKVVSDA